MPGSDRPTLRGAEGEGGRCDARIPGFHMVPIEVHRLANEV